MLSGLATREWLNGGTHFSSSRPFPRFFGPSLHVVNFRTPLVWVACSSSLFHLVVLREQKYAAVHCFILKAFGWAFGTRKPKADNSIARRSSASFLRLHSPRPSVFPSVCSPLCRGQYPGPSPTWSRSTSSTCPTILVWLGFCHVRSAT